VLADTARLTVAALSRIERGHTNPTWGTIVALATALNTTVADLAARSEAI
jgi:transcriptional regulator with XRE-family HTH domain